MKFLTVLAALLGALFLPAAHADPRPPELAALDRYLGVWDDTTDPGARVLTHCEWILDGAFLRHTWTLEDGKNPAIPIGMQMMAFDPVSKSYRGWTFFANGVVETGTGNWDEATRTFTWTIHSPVNKQTTVTKATFVKADQEDVEWTITGDDGQVLSTNRRRKTRRAEEPHGAPKETGTIPRA